MAAAIDHLKRRGQLNCSRMKTLGEIQCVPLSIAALFALLTLGAMPDTKKQAVIIIPITEIDRTSVRVTTSNQKGIAEVTFLFTDESLKEVSKMFAGNVAPVVRVTAGSFLFAEAPLSRCFIDESKSTNRCGLVLSFQSAEEAANAARLLRPPLHLFTPANNFPKAHL
jgi:hypothetical protein